MVKNISLIAPSYAVSEETVTQAKQYFENLGMHITVPPDLLGEDLLCAHQDHVRLSHLKNALEDPFIDVIWLLAGGYGLTRLMPDLLKITKPIKEKLFIGFSDGTALHVFLNQVWNWPSIHGVAARQITQQKVGTQTVESTLRLLKQGIKAYTPLTLQPFNKAAKGLSSLSGSLVGGNLCLLACSLGTDWQINPSGKILFLEDVDERGYRIDRMLVQLEQAHIFKNVKAIVLGDFVGGEEKDGTSLIPPVLKRFADNTKAPVFRLPGCGHGDENIPLLFNVPLDFSIVPY
ncbi:MAG: LD-carboxypeptidase [Proteobacteria bacterium]|nr:LD-carboxypeptidase [Pseudomonadota bacterium]